MVIVVIKIVVIILHPRSHGNRGQCKPNHTEANRAEARQVKLTRAWIISHSPAYTLYQHFWPIKASHSGLVCSIVIAGIILHVQWQVCFAHLGTHVYFPFKFGINSLQKQTHRFFFSIINQISHSQPNCTGTPQTQTCRFFSVHLCND